MNFSKNLTYLSGKLRATPKYRTVLSLHAAMKVTGVSVLSSLLLFCSLLDESKMSQLIVALRLVYVIFQVLNASGDEDICYYNFFCAHPLGVLR